MRVGVLTVLILFSSFEAASAQSIHDDPRRRRLVLPSVREATNCIAREALNEPGIEDAGGAGQFRAALASPMRRCADEVEAMIAGHDQVYYPGYGEAFFRGPYLQDLVRAIQKRIGPELARRATEERARVAQQPSSGSQVAQPAPKPFDQNTEQAKRQAEEREKREVDAMWQRSRLANVEPAPTPAATLDTQAAHLNTQSSPSGQSGEGGSMLGGIVVLIILASGPITVARTA